MQLLTRLCPFKTIFGAAWDIHEEERRLIKPCMNLNPPPLISEIERIEVLFLSGEDDETLYKPLR